MTRTSTPPCLALAPPYSGRPCGCRGAAGDVGARPLSGPAPACRRRRCSDLRAVVETRCSERQSTRRACGGLPSVQCARLSKAERRRGDRRRALWKEQRGAGAPGVDVGVTRPPRSGCRATTRVEDGDAISTAGPATPPPGLSSGGRRDRGAPMASTERGRRRETTAERRCDNARLKRARNCRVLDDGVVGFATGRTEVAPRPAGYRWESVNGLSHSEHSVGGKICHGPFPDSALARAVSKRSAGLVLPDTAARSEMYGVPHTSAS